MYKIRLSYKYNFKFLLFYNKVVSLNKYNIGYANLSHVSQISLFIFKYNYFFSKFSSFKLFIYSIQKILLFLFCNFLYSKIFLKVGLGFRKKYSRSMNFYIMNVGRRYWVIIKSLPSCYFFNVKRRSIFLYSNIKSKMYSKLNKLRILRKETVYKYKGLMTLNRIIFEIKISRSVLFARRVKFKNMMLKLTKKQRQKK